MHACRDTDGTLVLDGMRIEDTKRERLQRRWYGPDPVSYTHLTLPTIHLV